MTGASHEPAVIAALLRLAGARDAAGWLGLPVAPTPADIDEALERRRLWLERRLLEPDRAEEAELLADHHEEVRAWLLGGASRTDAADHYAALGVAPTASFSELHAAWRRGAAEGRPGVEAAWAVLGDPVLRAAYDRDRRARRPETGAPFSADPATLPPTITPQGAVISAPLSPVEVEARRLVLVGPPAREVTVDGQARVAMAVRVDVTGDDPVRVRVRCPHPAVSIDGGAELTWLPGHATLVVHIDPLRLDQAVTLVPILMAEARGDLTVTLRITRPRRQPRVPWLMLGAVFTMGVVLGVGVWVGGQLLLNRDPRKPTTEGAVRQLPGISACIEAARTTGAPLPAWIDVHIDGLGQPTGFHLQGAATADLDACVRRVLVTLAFPPTADGLPAMHRYQVDGAPAPGTTPVPALRSTAP